MAKREFKIGDKVIIANFMFQNMIGEIIKINSDISGETFKYVVKFKDDNICEFNENEMFLCKEINMLGKLDPMLSMLAHVHIDNNTDKEEVLELSFAELVNRANDIEFTETWMIKDTDSVIKLHSYGYIDFENCKHVFSNNRFVLIHTEKPMSFQEAFKHYLKAETIRLYYNKDVEFNIDPNSMQERIESVREHEIDEKWIVVG